MAIKKVVVEYPGQLGEIQSGDTATFPLASGDIVVGNVSGQAANVSVSGDATLSNAGALTLATVNSGPGTFTNATITVNGKGLVTVASDGSGSAAGSLVYSQTNGNAGTITIGQPVYSNGTADTVDLAQANASGTKNVIGLVAITSIATTVAGNIALSGVLSATTGEWDAIVTGESGGLTAGAQYWLDPATPGFLTATAPSTTGQYVAPLGTALSTTEFAINIQTTVEL